MCEIKTEYVSENFSKDKRIFDFSNCFDFSKSKYYDDSNKFVADKMRDETAGVINDEFAALKPNMYPFLVNDISEHEKAKGMNKMLLQQEVIIQRCLLNNKYLRHLMNRMRSKNHRIGAYEIRKHFLLCFDNKIYILNNGYDRLALCY